MDRICDKKEGLEAHNVYQDPAAMALLGELFGRKTQSLFASKAKGFWFHALQKCIRRQYGRFRHRP